ncbi:glycosyltransferase family 17 protein [Mycena albidolilacea]|uniref:Glycosyltransferase family 17 protein n=1 Tax=Mycena albidolilacea TaxID=1033008 RepID=A0AAD7A649_9AGAR|nr:glycosyltransferase family 17 protein [Mycena albidolilacea]
MVWAFFRLQRGRLLLLPAFVFTVVLFYLVSQNSYQITNALSSATRPIWDKAEGPKNIITHYYSEGLHINADVCKLHNWKPRAASRVKILDAILMSTELDLLEIRMNELDAVVDRFFIIESNATFTGLPKETFFALNRQRFAKFEKKISYRLVPGYALEPGQSPFDQENNHRVQMTNMLRAHIAELLPDTQTLVIMSDIDELPAAHTVQLLRMCDFGQSIHLQLRNYVYSFEWLVGLTSWRASVHVWNPDVYYRHGQSSDTVLADAGWHCSYCFRTISEYATKMQGFSHADRIGGRLDLLDPKRIQDTICKGKDIFGMLPEAYSYVDLFSKLSLEPLTTAVGLPLFLTENAERFRFLLPGGCQREAPRPSTETGPMVGDIG